MNIRWSKISKHLWHEMQLIVVSFVILILFRFLNKISFVNNISCNITLTG